MALGDRLVELLADEIAGSACDADCKATVTARFVVLEVRDEGHQVAYAGDVGLHVPDTTVGLVIEGWDCGVVGGRFGVRHNWGRLWFLIGSGDRCF